MPVPVRRAVIPPDRAALAKRLLGRVDALSCPFPPFGIAGPHRASLVSPGFHQISRQLRPFFRRQVLVGAAPEPAADDEVSAIRGDGISHVSLALIFLIYEVDENDPDIPK